MTALSRGSNPLLKTLRLQSNELDARAIDVLATAISLYLPSLVALELNGNYGEAEDECYVAVGAALEKWGHADALDELDELEERESEDEAEEDSEVEEEDDEVESRHEATVLVGQAETGGEDVRANEAEIVLQDKKSELEEPKKDDPKESDELANLLGKVHIA